MGKYKRVTPHLDISQDSYMDIYNTVTPILTYNLKQAEVHF